MAYTPYERIPFDSFVAAASAIERRRDEALAEWKSYRDTHCLRSSAEKERIAYLNGVLHGLGAAMRELEMRTPITWTGSDKPA